MRSKKRRRTVGGAGREAAWRCWGLNWGSRNASLFFLSFWASFSGEGNSPREIPLFCCAEAPLSPLSPPEGKERVVRGSSRHRLLRVIYCHKLHLSALKGGNKFVVLLWGDFWGNLYFMHPPDHIKKNFKEYICFTLLVTLQKQRATLLTQAANGRFSPSFILVLLCRHCSSS